MFSEKKLIHFAQSDNSSQKGAGAADPDGPESEKSKSPETPKTEEQIKLEKKQEQQKKVQELKLRLQKANIHRDTRELALSALSSDPESQELELIESLLKGTTTQKDFSRKLTLLIEKKRGLKNNNLPGIKQSIADRTAKLDQLKKVSPKEQKNSKEFSETTKQLNKLGVRELANQKDLKAILAPHLKSGKLTPEFEERLLDLNPSNPEFDKKLKLYLGDLADDKKLLQKIRLNKAEYKEINEQYEQYMSRLEDLMKADLNNFEARKKEQLAIRRLSRILGIDVKEGALLEYLDVTPSLQRTKATAQIQKIEYKQIPSVFYNEDESVTAETKKYEEEQKNMPFGLFITISSKDQPSTLDEKNFINWVNQVQAVEVIEDVNHLEQKIDFFEYGQKLKEGMSLEYVSGYDANSNPKFDELNIKEVDHKQGLIRLSKPITIVSEENAAQRETVTFGEFSRWFRRTHAEEKMTLEESKAFLKKMPLVYKNRYPDLDPNLWEFNDLPIELKEGEELIYGNNKKVSIKSVADNQVQLSNGRNYTPGQFVRFVKDNEVEKASRVPTKEEVRNKVKDLLEDQGLDSSISNPDPSSQTLGGPTNLNTEDAYETQGFFSKLWGGYTFLSLPDLARMIQVFEEYLKRRQERGSKRRVGEVGKKFPGRLGLEYQNLQQAAENEEVEKIKGELKEQGPDLWLEKLIESKGDTDVIKATTILLCETGNFDFDNPKIWMVYNEAYRNKVDDQTFNIYSINMSGSNNAANQSPSKALQAIMDELYGRRSGENWFNSNASAYKGEMDKLKEECNNLGSTPNGLSYALHDMLVKHQRGEFVPAYRYEGFIRYIIEAGKATANDKIFYIIAGFVTPNPSGAYLLSRERISSLESDLMKHMPHLDFFMGYKPFKEGVISESRQNMIKVFKNFGFNNNNWRGSNNNRYNSKEIDRFLWGDVMTHVDVMKRAGRISERGDANVDHDDSQIIVPMLDTENTFKMMGFTRGEVGFLTADGQANALSGYAEFLKHLGQNSMLSQEEQSARESLGYQSPASMIKRVFKSFFIYDSGMTGRVQYQNHAQLSSDQLNKAPPCIGEGATVGELAAQVREVLREVLKAYGASDASIKLYLDYRTGKSNEAKNKGHAEAMREFPAFLDQLISRNGPEKMIEVVQNAISSGKLVGYGGLATKASMGKKEEEIKDKTEEVAEFKDPLAVMGKTKKAANDATQDADLKQAA